MIDKSICSKILVIGTDKEGRGGIATVINHMSHIMFPFNYICSHKFTYGINKIWIIITAVVRTLYCLLFGGMKVMHIHSASYHSFYVSSIFILIGRLFRIKVILHMHGGKFFEFYTREKHFVTYVCSKIDCLVCVSHYFMKQFETYGLNKNVMLLHNPINIPDVQYLSKIGSREKRNVTFMGTIDYNKGIFDVLDLIIKDKDYFKNKINLYIAGVGEHEKLKRVIHINGLDSFVHYLGWIDEEQKQNILSVTDIYIQPSRFESLGISIIEAMSYGVPAIATDVGGIPDVIDNEFNGLLFPPNDYEAFIVRLKQFIEDEIMNKKFGIRARDKSLNFSLRKFETSLEGIYSRQL